MNAHRTKMQQFLLTICHAPMSQYIVFLYPPSSSGNPQTIWKYDVLYHLISGHSNNGILPENPGELLVKIFIHRTEEEAL